MTPLPVRPTPSILAHRGASQRYPENTLRALSAALTDAPAADGVELDVRLTADGVPVVFHDRETTRLTGVPGSIEERTLADLSELHVGGEPIPRLDALVDALAPLWPAQRRALLNVEIKPTGRAQELVAACRPILDPLAGRVQLVVSSFDARVLASASDAGAPWRLALLYETLDALDFLRFLEPRGPLDLHPDHQLVDPDHLARYGRPAVEYPGFRRAFRVWTVDDPGRARELSELGVAALITNTPQELRRALSGAAEPS